MQKDADEIPIFMTLNYRIFEAWLKAYNAEKWSQLSDDDKFLLCRNEWQKVYQMSGDYNIE